MKIPITPLSVNALYRGGPRYKTNEYKRYLGDLSLLLPPLTIPTGRISLRVVFAFSNPQADLDNALKAFIDALQSKYGFNDNRIFSIWAKKLITEKGGEYIAFRLVPAAEDRAA